MDVMQILFVFFPPAHFTVLMIPSVATVDVNKEIMLPAKNAISRGFPAAPVHLLRGSYPDARWY